MTQPSCICTVLLKLAKVERLKIPKFWVHVLFILKGWQAAINCVCKSPTILGSKMIILFIHGVSRSLPVNLSLQLFKTC